MNEDGQTNNPAEMMLDAVSAGGAHSCALSASGTLVCWGSDDYGQAQNGVQTLSDGEVVEVSAGADHTCAVFVDGTMNCWGRNDRGQAAGLQQQHTRRLDARN